MEEQQKDTSIKRKTVLSFLSGLVLGILLTSFISYKIFIPTIVPEEEYANEDVSAEIAALDAMVRNENKVAEAKDEKEPNNSTAFKEFLDTNEIPYVDLINDTLKQSEDKNETVAEKENAEETSEAIAAEDAVIETPEDIIVELKKKETLSKMLSRAGVEKKYLYKLTTAFGKKANVKRLRPGQKFILRMDNRGVSSLSMENRDGTVIVVKRNDDDSFTATQNQLKLEKTTVMFEGTVEDNFSNAASKAGMNSEQIKLFTTLYSDIVSFKKDVKKGDTFTAVYESMNSASGRIVRDMKLVFASFSVNGNTNNRYYYVTKDGFGDYYNSKGHSISRFLNVRPVNAKRISSRFGARFHPVLGRIGFHYGVDYAAKKGTPVYAAGDGVVTYVGPRGTYGNYVQIRHDRTYSTAYAHLKGFAKIKKGQRVKKGTLIAYVGNTGISTGPHLHFEVHKKGKKVDPLKQYAIAEKNLYGKELKKFHAFCEQINPRYAQGKGIEKASLDSEKDTVSKN